MKVVKINDNVRNDLSVLYDSISANEVEYNSVINSMYEKLKDKSDFSKYIVGLLLSTSYICLREEAKFRPNNKEYKEKIKLCEKIDNIDDYIDKMSINDLLILLDYNYNFVLLDYDTRREYINNSYDKKSYLTKIFPCHILDIVHYNIFTVDEIFDQYDIFSELTDTKKDALDNTIMYTSEKLIELHEENFENYELVMLNIIENYYLYNKYLILNNQKIDERAIETINDIEDDLYSLIGFCGNSSYFLEPIIECYIKYQIDEKSKRKVKKYFDNEENKKKISKLYKVINHIKYDE